jgi:hypothetical protein
MGTPDGIAGTAAGTHSAHPADCALGHHCQVPLQVGLTPPIQHTHTHTEHEDVKATRHMQMVKMSRHTVFPGYKVFHCKKKCNV